MNLFPSCYAFLKNSKWNYCSVISVTLSSLPGKFKCSLLNSFLVSCPDGITPNTGLTGPNIYIYIYIYIMIIVLKKTRNFGILEKGKSMLYIHYNHFGFFIFNIIRERIFQWDFNGVLCFVTIYTFFTSFLYFLSVSHLWDNHTKSRRWRTEDKFKISLVWWSQRLRKDSHQAPLTVSTLS